MSHPTVVHDETRWRRRLYLVLVTGVLVLAVLVVALVQSLPPRTVRMATGEASGAYHEIGRRYREILARDGVQLELVETRGSVDNLARLRDAASGVSVALAQGGAMTHEEGAGIVSLGTVAYEPVWAFYRGADLGLQARDWAVGKRISVGQEGSGTRRLAREVLALLGFDKDAQLLDLPSGESVQALLGGELDMVVLVEPIGAPAVQRLLVEPDIKLASFVRADAHVALRPYLNKRTLPQGVVDLRRNRPPQDVTLIAPKASLVVRSDLHPAIQYLLLQAAAEVHSRPELFQRAGEFPAAEPIDVPLSVPAANYYKSGSPFLQRYLPFWIAALASELLRMLIPLVAVIYPLLRLAPGVYGWGMRRRIFRLYGELKFIETQLEARDLKMPVDDLRQAMDQLELRANHMRTPSAFAHMLYTLRLHTRMVRERLDRR
jgi:TRAP transporter TAXI family solute receptor